MRDEALQVWLEPRAQRAIRECGLAQSVGSYIGHGAGLIEKLSKAERGFCLCLGQRSCVLNKYFEVQLLQPV